MRRYLLALPAVALALAFAACGDDSSDETRRHSRSRPRKATEAPTEAPTGSPDRGGAPRRRGARVRDSGVKVTGKVGEKPEIDTSGGKAPTELVIKDIEEGDGAEAKAGDNVSGAVLGALLKDGTAFDNSFDRGEPFAFPLGGGQVIPGWDQGVAGMKEGGRRVLVIPSDLGYGDAGSPADDPRRRDARLRRRPREGHAVDGGVLADGEDRGDERGQQEAVQGLPVHVVVVDPVQARAVQEAEPAADRGAQQR